MAFSPDDVFRRYGDIDVESNNGHIVVKLLQDRHGHNHRDSSNLTTSNFQQHRSFFLNISTTAHKQTATFLYPADDRYYSTVCMTKNWSLVATREDLLLYQ